MAPRAEKKIRRNLQGKLESAPPAHQVHPQAEQESILGHFWRFGGGMVDLVVLDRLLRATSKKNFFEKKMHPGENPGYAYGTRRVQTSIEGNPDPDSGYG